MLWVIKNWKLMILVASLLALCGLGITLYQKGKAQARLEQTVQNLQLEAAYLREQAARNSLILTQHSERAQEDARQITTLKERINGLREHVKNDPDRSRECLTDADTERLRDLWKPSPK